LKIVIDGSLFDANFSLMNTNQQTRYKIKGYPNSEIVFDYEEEVFYVYRDGIEIGSCLTASAAKELVKSDPEKFWNDVKEQHKKLQ
jgi:hypothetical protein